MKEHHNHCWLFRWSVPHVTCDFCFVFFFLSDGINAYHGARAKVEAIWVCFAPHPWKRCNYLLIEINDPDSFWKLESYFTYAEERFTSLPLLNVSCLCGCFGTMQPCWSSPVCWRAWLVSAANPSVCLVLSMIDVLGSAHGLQVQYNFSSYLKKLH